MTHGLTARRLQGDHEVPPGKALGAPGIRLRGLYGAALNIKAIIGPALRRARIRLYRACRPGSM